MSPFASVAVTGPPTLPVLFSAILLVTAASEANTGALFPSPRRAACTGVSDVKLALSSGPLPSEYSCLHTNALANVGVRK